MFYQYEKPSVFKIGLIMVIFVCSVIISYYIGYNLAHLELKKQYQVNISPEQHYTKCMKDYNEHLESLYEFLPTGNKNEVNMKLEILDRKYEMCQGYKTDIDIFNK